MGPQPRRNRVKVYGILGSGKIWTGVPAVAKLKEHQIMCAEELVKHQSVRKIASVFDADESTLRYRLDRKKAAAVDGRAL